MTGPSSSSLPVPGNRPALRVRPPRPRVVIVGGGLAGIACAAVLARRDLDVLLLESRPRLGGRAGSFPDSATGELVDNCQHIAMSCCVNLLDLAARLGFRDAFRTVDAIPLVGPDNRLSRLSAGLAPAPFHLAASFLRLKTLSWRDKLRVILALPALARRRGPEFRGVGSFADWLRRNRQTERAIALFWDPILVSALNETLDRIDARHARKVLVDGFARDARGWRPEIPAAPLGALFHDRASDALARAGVAVRLTTGVRSIEPAPPEPDDAPDRLPAVGGVLLRDGTRVPADFVVSAVPFNRVRDILAAPLRARLPGLERLQAWDVSPITGVHLWFDRPVCPLEFVGTPGRLVQWVFNHTALTRHRPTNPETQTQPQPHPPVSADNPEHLQLVVSASRHLREWSRDRLVQHALDELADIWPAAREARVVAARVVTEHAATFSVVPGVEAFRPHARPPVDGLLFAGDWTATGWPATMEGAVRSGYRAAEEILLDLGQPERVLIPDPPGSRLAEFLLGPPEILPGDWTLFDPDAPPSVDLPARAPLTPPPDAAT